MSNQFELKTGIRPGTAYIFELECVRGLAILLVFWFHAYGISIVEPNPRPSLPLSFILSGNSGVTLFFVLSGFLLSQPWLKAMTDNDSRRPGITSFYIARGLRILPLYFIAVLFSMAISGEWLTGLKALVFGFVGFEIFPYSVVWWTLSTEVQFYLLLPIIFSIWFTGTPGKLVLLAIAGIWLYFYIAITLTTPSNQIGFQYLAYKSLFARLPAFFIGAIAGYIYVRSTSCSPQQRPDLKRKSAALVLCIIALFTLGKILQAAAVLGGPAAEHNWHIHHTYESALWAILLLLLLLGEPLGKRLIVNRPMAITGKLSYSIYLIHVPILFYLIYPYRESVAQEEYLSSPLLYVIPVIGLLISLALAYVTYRTIELPFLKLKKKLAR